MSRDFILLLFLLVIFFRFKFDVFFVTVFLWRKYCKLSQLYRLYFDKNVDFSIEAVATVSFSEAQYVMVTLPEESSTEAEDISLRFRTVRSRGLLLITSSSISEDAIELYLERGACKLSVSLGRGSKVR